MQRQPGWDWGRGSTCLLGLVLFLVACTNDPYPSADSERRILYTTFSEAPKTLDPAIAYTTTAHAITGNIYEGLLEYHYLKRPYELIPALAEQVPSAEVTAEGHTVYRFRIRNGVLYQDDPCFAAQGTAGSTREVVAQDFAFEFARIADPAVGSPVVSNFSKIMGLRALTQKLGELREDPSFAALPVSVRAGRGHCGWAASSTRPRAARSDRSEPSTRRFLRAPTPRSSGAASTPPSTRPCSTCCRRKTAARGNTACSPWARPRSPRWRCSRPE